MMLIHDLRISALQMRSRPVRTGLSLIGVFIGVFSVIVILTIQEGARRQITSLFSTHGANVVYVHPGFDQVTRKIGHLNLDDASRLRQIPEVLGVYPRLTLELGVRSTQGSQNAQVAGVDAGFVSVYRIPVLEGRTFIEDEAEHKQPVCLLRRGLAQELFRTRSALGETVYIGAMPFQVIGLFDWSNDVSLRTSLRDMDVLVPQGFLISQANQFLSTLEVRLPETISSDQAIRIVKEGITRRDPTRESQYFVRSIEQLEQKTKESQGQILIVLLSVAAVSLLVGGIGIANVMVTSVTERTREVGIRKALGARRIDILTQFLVESALLSLTGGLLAVGFGLLGVSVLPSLMGLTFPLFIPMGSILLCVGITLVIGILAGLYPASQAASLSPAEALRYE